MSQSVVVSTEEHQQLAPGASLNTLADYERAAEGLLPRALFDMVKVGSLRGWSTDRIRPVYDSIGLRPHAFGQPGPPDVRTSVQGSEISMPIMPAAPGLKRYSDVDGERATVRAAAEVGTATLIPHIADYDVPIDDISRAAAGIRWFQLFVVKDRGATAEILGRAVDAGCSAVVLTVSGGSPYPAIMREAEIVHRWYEANEHSRYTPSLPAPLGTSGGPEFHIEYTVDWSILEWIRSLTDLPLIVKGLVSQRDARRAMEVGVDGIVVSTHAARLFDGAVTTIEALPGVVDVVDGRCEVYVDGGITTGADVFRALALGARACLIGKPLFYALEVEGQQGVVNILNILRDELTATMKECGVSDIAGITSDLVARPSVRGWRS